MEVSEWRAKLRGHSSTYTSHQPAEGKCQRGTINADGDLLFVAAGKNIYGYNLMTEVCFREYTGHTGMVEDLAVNDTSTQLASVASGTGALIVQDVETGNIVGNFETMEFMSCCAWAPGRINRLVAFSTTQMRQTPTMFIFHPGSKHGQLKGKVTFPSEVHCVIWPTDSVIICGDKEGRIWRLEVDKIIDYYEKKITSLSDMAGAAKSVEGHRGQVNNLTLSANKRVFASASSEAVAATWDLDLNRIGTFPHKFVVSCAAIAPTAPHIVLASSADKASVARTNTGSTDFTINFFNVVFHEEFASMKVARSPVNWVGFTPDGLTLVTTHEEGTFSIIRLGAQYMKLAADHQKELNEYEGSIKTD